MTEKVEFFNRALCFTPGWGLVDMLLIFHFFFSWYRSAKKTKWKIDPWYLTLFIAFFPSLFLLYPFNGSIYNNVATMGFQYRILPYVDLAFFISALGYSSIWIGRYLFDLTRGNFPFIILFRSARPIFQMIETNIKNKNAFLFIVLTAFFLGFIILGIQFKEGCFFNARGLFLKEPLLRPLFNLTISIFPIASSFLALRYVQFKEKKCLIFLFILLLFTLFFGVRALCVSGILFLLMQWIFYREGRCSFFHLAGVCAGLFIVAILLGNFREGNFNLQSAFTSLLFKLFYGNNFSDTRDFAWILAFWDEEYVYGKTYLAALISFIPRAFSSLREEWGISMYTNALTGFDSNVMPGLRPGMFGEAFLNFSYPGVMIFGMLFGFALRYSDFKIKEYVTKSKDIIKGYSYSFVLTFLSHLSVSAGMWSFYVFLLLNFAALLIRSLSPKQTQPSNIELKAKKIEHRA
jgi:hypothetical protein